MNDHRKFMLFILHRLIVSDASNLKFINKLSNFIMNQFLIPLTFKLYNNYYIYIMYRIIFLFYCEITMPTNEEKEIN